MARKFNDYSIIIRELNGIAAINAFLDDDVIDEYSRFLISGMYKHEQLALLSNIESATQLDTEHNQLIYSAITQIRGYPHQKFTYIEENYGISKNEISKMRDLIDKIDEEAQRSNT